MKGVRVYTIGMGLRGGGARSMIEQALGGSADAGMNADLLQQIAAETGGRYFEAANMQDLSSVYETIGSLEKSEVKLNEFVTIHELFPNFVAAALFFMLFGWLLDLTWLRKAP